MKPITVTLTEETAQALLWALREHMTNRTPVREYVDRRYVGHDESFRNCKIGEVQARLDRLRSLTDRIQTEITKEVWKDVKGETK